MTVTVKEEKRMETPTKTYLQTYEEHIRGYKHYKMERISFSANDAKAPGTAKK